MPSVRTISLRTPAEKVSALDALALAQHRDRSYLVNEAIDYYLELHAAEAADIEARLRESDSEEGIPHAQVSEIVAGWRKS